MRKSFLFLMGFLLVAGSAFAGYDEPTYQEAHKVNNSALNQKEAYREIKLVRYAERGENGTSLVSGDAVVYSNVSNDGVSVLRTIQSADGSFAGIVCTTIQTGNTGATIYSDNRGDRNWGYIVVYGPANAGVTAGGANGAIYGDPFITSSDVGKITTITILSPDGTAGTGGNSTAGNLQRLGRNVAAKGGFFMQSADGTSTSYEVFVQAT